jgi:peroxiredoxin
MIAKQARRFGVPAFLLLAVTGWMLLDGLQAKYRLSHQYALPADHSPRSMLDFIRKMDGSMEVTEGIVRTDNAQEICNAVLAACEYIPNGASELSEIELREVAFYRIKYTGGAFMRGIIPDTHNTVAKLLDDVRGFIAEGDALGTREQHAVNLTLHVLEGTGRYSEELDFIHWLTEHLAEAEPSLQNDAFAQRLQRIAKRLSLVNSELAIQSTTLSGEEFNMQSLRGKVVLVEFWGTRCQPCIADFPALKRIYRTYHHHGFEIVGICLNAEPERIRRCAADNELPWIQLCQNIAAGAECNAALSDRFGIEAVPATFLVDTNGRVVAQGVRPLHGKPEKDLEKWLEQLLP